MINKRVDFSIIVPTYTGADTIEGTFKSILNQLPVDNHYEVVVVIDGPQPEIRKIVDAKRPDFAGYKIPFRLEHLNKNVGRFDARLTGAKLAKSKQLLFVDDRVILSKDLLGILVSLKQEMAIGNIVEISANKTNIISKTLHLLRKKIYGRRWGETFKDYYINKSNFESSPKGTTLFWVGKERFIEACSALIKESSPSNRYINEDTKIMRVLVDNGGRIFRSSKLVAYYQPRSNFLNAVKHLYNRGPRFVDYYRQPSTRFFPLLIFIYAVLAIAIMAAILRPQWLVIMTIGAVGLLLLLAASISRNFKEFVTAAVGLPLVFIIFSAGVLKGTVVSLRNIV